MSAGRYVATQEYAVLTRREQQVLELTGLGLDCRELAAELGLSSKTVDVHKANIRRKLRLPCTLHVTIAAVHYALEQRRVRQRAEAPGRKDSAKQKGGRPV